MTLGLRLLVRVPPGKRQELVQAFSSFFAEDAIRPSRRFVLQDVNDENLICWLGDWRDPVALERFMSSATYRALRGAARVLGHVEDIQVTRAVGETVSTGDSEVE